MAKRFGPAAGFPFEARTRALVALVASALLGPRPPSPKCAALMLTLALERWGGGVGPLGGWAVGGGGRWIGGLRKRFKTP